MTPRRNGRAVLVVDDEPEMRALFTTVLKRAGVRVTGAATVAAALDAMRDGAYDLLVTDLELPDGTGKSVTREFKTLHPEKPIVLMTGLEIDDCDDAPRRYEVDEFLYKPFDISTARALVMSLLPEAAQ